MLKLKPVSFTYKPELKGPGQQVGFIAEDVVKVVPEVVGLDEQGRPSNVDYAKFVPVLVNAIKEIAGISGAFKANLIAWLGDSANGIQKLFANEIDATNIFADTATFGKLCVKDDAGVPVCVSGTQLRSLLSGSVLGASTSQAAAGAPAAGLPQGAPTTMPGTQSATSGPPIITINGDNPATVNVGATYADLGARITGPHQDLNLGIHLDVDGTPESAVQLDTSKVGTHKVDYVVTGHSSLTATSTRTVIVSALKAANDNAPAATNSPIVSTSTPPLAPAANDNPPKLAPTRFACLRSQNRVCGNQACTVGYRRAGTWEAIMSRPHDILFDRHFREARQRIKEQEARLHRLIVQGFPSQSVADTLRAMQEALRQSEKERRTVR